MISRFISSTPAPVTGGGSIADVYSDKTDDNYGIGEGLAFHADATDNIAIGENALNSTAGASLRNIAIGTNSLTAIIDNESDNIAIGSGSMSAVDQGSHADADADSNIAICLLYTSPSPRDRTRSRMPSSA